MSHTLKIDYSDDILASLGLSREQFEQEARLLVAGKLYESGRLTAGQAAQLCGKRKVDFLMSLASVGINACNLSPEDAETEIGFGRRG